MAPQAGRGPRLLILRAAFGAAILLAAGCRGPAAAEPVVAIEQEIAPWPARVGPVILTLKMKDAARRPARGASITLEANMSHPGMRPEFGEAKETAPGTYRGKVALTMPGDWVILMHIQLAGGRLVERQMEVPGVRAN